MEESRKEENMNSKKGRNIAIVIGILVLVPMVVTAVTVIVLVMDIAHLYGYGIDGRNIPADAPIREEYYVPILDGLRDKRFDYTFSADTKAEILKDKDNYHGLQKILQDNDGLKMEIHVSCEDTRELYRYMNTEQYGDITIPGQLKDENNHGMVDIVADVNKNSDTAYDDIYHRSDPCADPCADPWDNAISSIFSGGQDYGYRINDGGSVLHTEKNTENGKTEYVMSVKYSEGEGDHKTDTEKEIRAIINDATKMPESIHIKENTWDEGIMVRTIILNACELLLT